MNPRRPQSSCIRLWVGEIFNINTSSTSSSLRKACHLLTAHHTLEHNSPCAVILIRHLKASSNAYKVECNLILIRSIDQHAHTLAQATKATSFGGFCQSYNKLSTPRHTLPLQVLARFP